MKWLTSKTGKAYRILSEAEWEYVARAGTHGPFHVGSTISRTQANYNGNEGGRTVPVGLFPANRFGLHDIHGNAMEWVEDCWHVNYESAPLDGRPWTTLGDCDLRVLRGFSVMLPVGIIHVDPDYHTACTPLLISEIASPSHSGTLGKRNPDICDDSSLYANVLLSMTTSRWDINIRESIVLGLVGAGGIGIQLDASISNLAWTQVSLILIAILAAVIVSEWISAKVRHAII